MLCPDCITPQEQQEIDEEDMDFVEGIHAWRREVGISTDLSQADFAAEKVRENRLRRAASRRGLQLVKSRRRDPHARDYGLFTLVDSDDIPVAGGGIEDIEDWLAAEPGLATAVPGLIFAFRDDGDGRRIGDWYPCRPDYFLPDGWAVGASIRLAADKPSPFADHELIFAYEDRQSGRLRDDSPGYIYHFRNGTPRRATAAVHDAIWSAGDEQTPLRRAATRLVYAMQALGMYDPGVLIRAHLDNLVEHMANTQLPQEPGPLLAAAQAVLHAADQASSCRRPAPLVTQWEREVWTAIEMLRAAHARYPVRADDQPGNRAST
jgi:hypothetical protein